MTPIKNIAVNSQEIKNLQKENDLKRIREAKASKSSAISAKSSTKVRSEKVNISLSGKKMLEQKADVSRYLAELKNLDSIDQKSSALIKNKISTGFYSKPSIVDKISDALLALPMFSGVRSPGIEQPTVTDEKSKQLSQIKGKLERGAYDADEVLDVIVDRLSDIIDDTK